VFNNLLLTNNLQIIYVRCEAQNMLNSSTTCWKTGTIGIAAGQHFVISYKLTDNSCNN